MSNLTRALGMIEDGPARSQELPWLVVRPLKLRFQLALLGYQTGCLLASLEYFKYFLIPLGARLWGTLRTVAFNEVLDLRLGGFPQLVLFVKGGTGRIFFPSLSELSLAYEVGVRRHE